MMSRFCALWILLCGMAYAAEPSGVFLRDWLLLGPIPLEASEEEAKDDSGHVPGFETDLLAANGGEARVVPAEGGQVSAGGTMLTWQRHTAEAPAVDLDAFFGDVAPAAAYAYTELESPVECAAVLSVGSNDGARVWLNEDMVWDRVEGGAVRLDADLIPVHLRAGKNRLLLKIEERGGAWGYCCRLLPFGHPELPIERLALFEIAADEGAAPVIRMRDSAQELLGQVSFSAWLPEDCGESAVPLWQAAWQGETAVPIGVDATNYGEYVLRMEAVAAGGTPFTSERTFTAGVRVEQVLFEGGSSDYRIVVAADASDSEQWAAQELQHWLQEISGVKLTIEPPPAAPSDGTPCISIGFNAFTQSLAGGAALEDADQSFTYRNAGRHILIWGGRQCGTMYGVFTFLERELGCRWYTRDAEVIPQRNRYAFTRLYHHDAPAIRVRNVFYFEAFDPLWAARNKSNGELTFGAQRQQPGGVESYSGVHTMGRFIPEKEFFEEHPEYFSLIDGKRQAHEAQVCMTNPDVLRITIERVRAHMREHPEHLIYSVSQNDGYNPCQCEKCQAIVEREGSEQGPILWFVNQVADAVKDEFPDKFIGTLAYVYSSKAPKYLRPRDNVVIRLCAFDGCWAHPFDTCPKNAYFVRDIEDWAKICSRIYVWDYVVSFHHYLAPFPNFPALQPRIQYLRDHNAIGVMPQAAYNGPACEFSGLRAYLIAKLLWNPDVDAEAVIDDYMYGYFGRSGQQVRAYFDLLQGLVTEDTHFRGIEPDDPLFTDDFMRKSKALFDQAEAVADNDEIRRRVERARLPLLYLECARNPVQAREDGAYARFRAVVEREGVTHYREGGQGHREAFHTMVETAE